MNAIVIGAIAGGIGAWIGANILGALVDDTAGIVIPLVGLAILVPLILAH
jgi:hypothetical protein